MRFYGVGLAVLAVGSGLTYEIERPTAVGISAREFRLTPYRDAVPVGAVKFNLRNAGEDGHNLVVISPRGKLVAKSPEVAAGKNYTLKTRLTVAGTYRLACTIANHAQRGMRSSISAR